MLDIRNKLKWCVIGNTSVLLMLIVVIFAFDNDGRYARFGPSDELIVISVKIDTFAKYGALLCFIAIINTIQILSEDIGNPILGFNIFNPDKKHIVNFTKNELWAFAVIMFSTGAFRNPLLTLLSISQIDIALFSVMVKEIVGVITMRLLLNEKTYGPVSDELTELVIES